MMASGDDGVGPRKRRKIDPRRSALYVLRQLLDEVPLSAEDGSTDVHITCVEYWNENLYIGTSAAEILHFVCLPPEPSSDVSEPSFILATRLPLPYPRNPSSTASQHGIQQILLLPTVNKACVLCNSVVTFYLLPELSPAFGNTKVSNCCWIGGVDLNRSPDDTEDPVIMIGHQNRIMLVRIRDEARLAKNIPFSGCLVASRRGTIACAADGRAYSLLELEHQQKIPLFPISSSSEVFESGHPESLTPQTPRSGAKRSPSASYPSSPPPESHSHTRSSSLNTVVAKLQPNHQSDRLRPVTPDQLPKSESTSRSQSRERDQSSARNSSELPGRESQSTSSASAKPLPPVPKPVIPQLIPHILSPTNSEFLLVTGTEKSDPGVGMFVNVDGDVVRGTLQFERYPEALAVDTGDEDDPARSTSRSSSTGNIDNILAVIEVKDNDEVRKRLEIQHWDVGPGDDQRQKSWVEIPKAEETESTMVGIGHTISSSQLNFPDLGKLLRMVRLKTPTLSPHVNPGDPRTQESIEQHQKEKELFESQELSSSGSSESAWEMERNAEEAKFADGLGKIRSSLVLWSGKQIWRVVRNPSTIQLDDAIRSAEEVMEDGSRLLHRDWVMRIIESLRDAEPKSEAEFLGFNYVKQKASLLLFADLLTMDPGARSETIIQETETALLAGSLDPRVTVMLVPLLRGEVLQGPQGIWVNAGLAATAEECMQRTDQLRKTMDSEAVVETAVLDMLKRFLLVWQQKRGYGSITDETYVFDSVDASLLHLLLELDSPSQRMRGATKSVRAELHNLVGKWKGDFERAVILIEEYGRLYVLSVLYQSRRMSGNVLKTWRRIVEGERDDSGEVTASEIENKMRNYLVRIKDAQLVEEYGSWLAARNPGLGIRVFADKESRVKLDPTEVVTLLKERAPNAVQEYLEHLVFTKNYTQYIDDLISYYLDNVLTVLESSADARTSLSESYVTYRALRPPKPTYINFITENLPTETWWQSRLRLLQLLGAGSGSQFAATPSPAALNFSIPAVLSRIEPFQNELVSECIILDGLQGRHQQALRLLTHGLGDYDSAVRYCLFGGPRSSTPSGGMADFAARSTQTELFRYLLDEFLQIQDTSERIERTSDLLARFAAWFDVSEVLRVVPSDWSVEILSGFFSHVFRALISESRQVKVERALSASLNLRVGFEYIEGVEKAGGWIEDDAGLHKLKEKSNRDTKHLDVEDAGDVGDMIAASGIPTE